MSNNIPTLQLRYDTALLCDRNLRNSGNGSKLPSSDIKCADKYSHLQACE